MQCNYLKYNYLIFRTPLQSIADRSAPATGHIDHFYQQAPNSGKANG
jgi:hypothetical protein